MKKPAFQLFSAVAGLVLSAGCLAQATPSAEQMIEQLKPPARTRSLRNLTIEATPGALSPQQSAGQEQTPGNTAANKPGGTSTPVAAVNPAVNSNTPAPARPSLSLLIQFDFNSANVRAESQQALANLSRALKSSELSSFRFAVEGHTDAKGKADYNQRLSQLRAEAVRSFLASEGVDPKRLVASGKGSSEPANASDPYAAENRRVRIVNLD